MAKADNNRTSTDLVPVRKPSAELEPITDKDLREKFHKALDKMSDYGDLDYDAMRKTYQTLHRGPERLIRHVDKVENVGVGQAMTLLGSIAAAGFSVYDLATTFDFHSFASTPYISLPLSLGFLAVARSLKKEEKSIYKKITNEIDKTAAEDQQKLLPPPAPPKLI